MGAIAAIGPHRVAAVVFMLSRDPPIRLLLAFLTGGFGMTLAIGGLILFTMQKAGIQFPSLPAEIEIAMGLAALISAALVASGLGGRVLRWSRSEQFTQRLAESG